MLLLCNVGMMAHQNVENIDRHNVTNGRAYQGLTSCMKSWLGLGQVAAALRRDIANPADRHATEKK